MRMCFISLGLLLGSFLAHATENLSTAGATTPAIPGVWKLVGYKDYYADGTERDSMGPNARGIFVYSRDGYMSLHVVHTESRKPVTCDSNNEALVEAFTPYIGYFGTYSVDYTAMTLTHNIEGAKLPNREGTSAVRPFYFEEGDLILDFKSASGMRFYRRLTRIENL